MNALELSQLTGWKVFPCYRDKKPMVKGGYKAASNDPEVIRKWLNNHAFVGIACKPSGLFAIDLDVKDGVNGLDDFEALVTQHNGGVGIPTGPVQDTPSGGQHLLYKYPANIHIPNNVKKLAPGIDLRSEGYICTGNGYTWLPEHGPDAPLTDAPSWLLKLIDATNPKHPEPSQEFLPVNNAPQSGDLFENLLNKAIRESPGRRDDSGLWLACQLRDNGLSRGECEGWMMRYQAAVVLSGDHPWTKSEARAKVKSAYARPARDPIPDKPLNQPSHEVKEPEFAPDDIEYDNGDPVAALDGEVERQAPKAPPAKTSWSLSELYDTEFPEPSWCIPLTIPVGLFFFGGRPKVGKSYFMLQVADAKATGGSLFGNPVKQGDVLYLAYEDNPRRIKDRCKIMGIPKDAPIRFEFTWKPLHQGGLNDLLVAIECGSYALVVIDTLSRAIPGVDQIKHDVISPIIDQLQRLALGHNMTIALVDHTRKPNGMYLDPIDDIMGSTAKAANADAVLAIYKEQGKAGATLKGRGKDIEEIDLSLEFDPVTRCWQSNGNADDIKISDAKDEILEYLRTAGKSQLPSIYKAIGKDRSNTYKHLQDMFNHGDLRKENIDNKVYYEVIK